MFKEKSEQMYPVMGKNKKKQKKQKKNKKRLGGIKGCKVFKEKSDKAPTRAKKNHETKEKRQKERNKNIFSPLTGGGSTGGCSEGLLCRRVLIFLLNKIVYTCQKKIEEGHSIKRVWYNASRESSDTLPGLQPCTQTRSVYHTPYLLCTGIVTSVPISDFARIEGERPYKSSTEYTLR